jgi:hypothetical protein
MSALAVVGLAVLAVLAAGAVLAWVILGRVGSGDVSDALEQTRSFVRRYWGDALGPEEVLESLQRMVRMNPRGIRQGADAIDAVLADPPESGALVQLVAWDGNYPLDTGTDEEAAQFLREFASTARGVLAERHA